MNGGHHFYSFRAPLREHCLKAALRASMQCKSSSGFIPLQLLPTDIGSGEPLEAARMLQLSRNDLGSPQGM